MYSALVFGWVTIIRLSFVLLMLAMNSYGSWPTASSRVGQDIEIACESDMDIALYWHSEHGFRCQTQTNLFLSPTDPLPCELDGSCGWCEDYMLLGCNCGFGLWHCPSGWRVVRYYSCDPSDPSFLYRVKNAHDGSHVLLASASERFACESEKVSPVSDDGDSYGNDDYGNDVGGGGSGGSGGGSSGGSGGDTGGDDTGDGGGGGGGGSGGGSVDPNDYDCAEEIISSDSSSAYISCQSDYSTIRSSLYNNGAQEGIHYLSSCGTHTGCSGTIRTPYYEGCDCNYLDDEAYWISCYSVWPSGCWSSDGEYVGSCTEKIEGPYYSTQHKNCSLSIPAPDGMWLEEWAISLEESCVDSCQEHRDNYSDQYPSNGGGSGSDVPTEYEECAAAPNCRWVGAPMGFGVCHCSGSDVPVGDEGTAPTKPRPTNVDGNDDGEGVCGQGSDGTSCEVTQQKVLEAVSEAGENIETFSQYVRKGSNSIPDFNIPDFDISEISDNFNSTIEGTRQQLSQKITQIRQEAASIADSYSTNFSIPADGGSSLCIEGLSSALNDFFGTSISEICIDKYLYPFYDVSHIVLDFMKFSLMFFWFSRRK